MKIKTQIFIIAICLTILPLAVVSTMLITFYNEELNKMAVDDLRSTTAAQIDIIDNFFTDQDINMSILMDYDMLHRLLENQYNGDDLAKYNDQKVMKEIFQTQIEKREFLYSITALDQDFMTVACTKEFNPNDVSTLKGTKMLEQLDHEIWFSHVLEKGESGASEQCLVAVKAIYNEQDMKIGYLIEEIALDFFNKLRITTKLIQEGSVYITDGRGGIITAGTSEQNLDQYKLNQGERGGFTQAWEKRDLLNPIGVIQYKIGTVTYLTSYGGFRNSDWQILSTVCLDDIMHTKENFIQVFVIAVVVTILLSIIVNVIMRRMLSDPIEHMVTTFADIREHNDFSKRIQGFPHNEIGVIAEGINELLTDMEDTIRHQEENLKILKERSERDALTNLFNKNTIREVLTMKLDSARMNREVLFFVFVDIDDFKYYNTTFGHSGGDIAIQFVASVMQEISLDMAGRVGGDEFIMCLDSYVIGGDVSPVMDRFIQRLEEGIDIMGEEEKIPVHCSIGVTKLTGRMDLTYEAILEMADKAMYHVKNTTKNSYHVISQ